MTERSEQPQEVQPVAPGTVVTPGGAAPVLQAPATAEPIEPEAPKLPESSPAAAQEPQPQAPQEPEIPQQPGMSQFQLHPSEADDPDSVTWTASEFIAHDKTSSWYTLLILGTVAASGLMYVVTKDIVSVGVVILAALIFGIYGAHKPRQLVYRVDLRGITVGGKFYPYSDFRSFSVIPEGAFSSIVFMPLKRFAAPLSIYYAPQDEDRIVGVLSEQLPYEQRRRDAVDSLMRKIRF